MSPPVRVGQGHDPFRHATNTAHLYRIRFREVLTVSTLLLPRQPQNSTEACALTTTPCYLGHDPFFDNEKQGLHCVQGQEPQASKGRVVALAWGHRFRDHCP